MTRTTKREKDAQPTMAEAIGRMQGLGLSSLAWLGAAWAEKMGEMSSEVLQFMADRIKEDVKFQHACLHCKDPAQLQKLQGEFIQKAIDQYTAETGKLAEMSASLIPGLDKEE